MASNTTGKLIIILSVLAVGAVSYQNIQDKSAQRVAKEKQAQQAELDRERFYENKDAIIAQANEQLAKGQAREVIANITAWLFIQDKELTEVYGKARTIKITNDLKSIPTEQYSKNLNLYKELLALNRGNEKYAEKVAFYQDKYDGKKREDSIIAEHKKEIEQGFSKWSGAHLALEREIIKSMKDPDSYEHIETIYRDQGDYLFVTTKFRGTNSFGAKVINSVSAKTSISGIVVEMY